MDSLAEQQANGVVGEDEEVDIPEILEVHFSLYTSQFTMFHALHIVLSNCACMIAPCDPTTPNPSMDPTQQEGSIIFMMQQEVEILLRIALY